MLITAVGSALWNGGGQSLFCAARPGFCHANQLQTLVDYSGTRVTLDTEGVRQRKTPVLVLMLVRRTCEEKACRRSPEGLVVCHRAIIHPVVALYLDTWAHTHAFGHCSSTSVRNPLHSLNFGLRPTATPSRLSCDINLTRSGAASDISLLVGQ